MDDLGVPLFLETPTYLSNVDPDLYKEILSKQLVQLEFHFEEATGVPKKKAMTARQSS